MAKVAASTSDNLRNGHHVSQDHFSPTMFDTERDKKLQKEGVFKAVLWPAIKKNPFIPLGVIMTGGALLYALQCFGLGHQRKSEILLGYRIYFHALTLAAISGGYALSTYKDKNRAELKSLQEQLAQLDAERRGS